jgi:hypothetical protein
MSDTFSRLRHDKDPCTYEYGDIKFTSPWQRPNGLLELITKERGWQAFTVPFGARVQHNGCQTQFLLWVNGRRSLSDYARFLACQLQSPKSLLNSIYSHNTIYSLLCHPGLHVLQLFRDQHYPRTDLPRARLFFASQDPPLIPVVLSMLSYRNIIHLDTTNNESLCPKPRCSRYRQQYVETRVDDIQEARLLGNSASV